MKLTKREAMLITFLAFFAVTVLSVLFVIKPMMEVIKSNTATLEMVKIEKENMIANLALVGKYEGQLDEKKLLLQEEIAFLVSNQSNSELSKYIMEIARVNQITMLSYSISDAQVEAVPSYLTEGQPEVSYPIKEYLYAVNNLSDQIVESKQFDEVLLMHQLIDCQIECTYAQYLKFIDAIKGENRSIKVINASKSVTEEAYVFSVQISVLSTKGME